jgi:hypothetical protein
MNPNEHIAPGDPNLGPTPSVGGHSHQGQHGHVSHGDQHSATSGFNPPEVAGFQEQDFAAGKAVVVLMLGIFVTGVILYSIVAYNVLP